MEYVKLSKCAFFSTLRTKEITLDNYITTENMLPNKGGVCLVSELPSVNTASKYEKNDILLSNIRPYFKKIWLADKIGSCSNDVLVVKSKEGYLPKFLYYVLSDNNFFNYATVTSKGTKMPRGTPRAIMKYLVPDVTVEKQKKIADILSTYDDLIENNNKRIKILEQMAENLYQEWFVRFRFPRCKEIRFKESSLGRIPETFSIVKMKDVIGQYIGGGWGNDDEDKNYSVGAFVIRGTDFPYVKKGDLSTCPFRYHKPSNYTARQLKLNDIILEVSGGTAEQPVGRSILVTEDTLKRLKNRVICASFCKMLRLNTNIIQPSYFIYWMNYLYETRIIDKFQLQSTGIINFKFEYFLRKGDVLLPPADLMDAFSANIQKLKMQIDKLAEINQNLIKQRDMLLPRLMSGKLEVKEAQEKVVAFKPKKTFAEFKNEFKAAARKDGGLTEQDMEELYKAYCDDSRDE